MAVEPKGIAVNPRSGERLHLSATIPTTYAARTPKSFQDEHPANLAGNKSGMEEILKIATDEAKTAWFQELAERLASDLALAESDEEYDRALRRWSETTAANLVDGRWEECLDVRIWEDELNRVDQ